MKTDENFKKQFKSMFIRSIKSGFNLDDIRKKLKQQSYPSDLANKLIEELKTDKDIIGLIQELRQQPKKKIQVEKSQEQPIKKQPNFFQKIIKKLFKPSQSKVIKKLTKIHSLYYNIIISQKQKLNEKSKEIDNIMQNSDNKKLTSYYIKSQTHQIKSIQKNINKVIKIAKSLVDANLKKETKENINKILKYIQIQSKELRQEFKSINNLKNLLQDELKHEIQKQKSNIKIKENSLQRTISEISRKSERFKEAVSQL